MGDQIKIDKYVPLPSRGNATKKYPANDMDVGDSFFVPGGTVRALCFSSLRPKKFAARTREEDGIKGVRVWRTE